jgi:TonB family protein
MAIFRRTIPIVLFVCTAVCAKSGSSSTQGVDSKPTTTQPSQSPPDSDKKPSPDQSVSAPPADSTSLKPVKTEKADYPWEARKKHLQGQVWVRILISKTGDVENVEVISGDPVLARSAVGAAKKWKFKPFIKNGEPVPVVTKLPFNFAFSGNVHEHRAPSTEADAATATSTASASDEPPKQVRISEDVATGLLVHQVAPVYPPETRQAGIQGTVVLQAVISKEGRVTDLQLTSGPKELGPAAIGAVQQWRYRPYLVMGNPVEVQTQIHVKFWLQ